MLEKTMDKKIKDSKLANTLIALKTNPNNSIIEQEIVDIFNGVGEKKKHVATIYTRDKYIEFHGEYTQIAFFIDELKPLIELYGIKKTNLE